MLLLRIALKSSNDLEKPMPKLRCPDHTLHIGGIRDLRMRVFLSQKPSGPFSAITYVQ